MKKFILLFAVFLLLIGCASHQSKSVQPVTEIAPINKQPPQVQQQFNFKRKIAIGRFSNETKAANSFLTEGTNVKDRMSKQASDILTSKLAMTNNFILIERQDTIAISNEQKISNIQKYNIPADYMIVGSISEFGRKVTGNVGLIDRTKAQTAYAKVTLRIVDTRTGLIIYGEEGSGEATVEVGTVLGMGSQAGFDETLSDKAIDAAISSVVQNLLNKLYNEPWKSYILEVDKGSVYISGGQLQGIKVGDIFNVNKRGKQVMNPQTGIPIELPSTSIAKIKVVTLVPGQDITEMSICQIIEGSLDNTSLKELYVSEVK